MIIAVRELATWARRRGLVRRVAAALALTSIITGLPLASVAVAQPAPASLVGVTMSDGAPGETKVLLSFNQIIPQFSIVANDVDHASIGFGDTVRGSTASVPPGARGVLKSIEFNQRGSVLTVAFVGTEPIHIDATAIGGHAVSLSIKAAGGAVKAALESSAGPLPTYTEPKVGQDDFEVVPLKYADVSEVVGLLSAGQAIRPNDAFTPQEPAFGASGFTNNGGGGNNTLLAQPYNPNAGDAASTTYGQSIDDSIGVDRRLNAIILKGSPERIATLKARIEAIDVPVKSVLLETVFVELTETGARDIGLDFNNTNGQIAVGTFQRGAYIGNNGGSGLNVSGYGSFALQAAIYAEVKKGQGRIVSRPSISAQSGTSAKIITGDALPILTSIALSGLNALQQQVQYVNVGVTLQIAPRVSADGYVTSHIFAEVSSVTGFSQGYPTISQREATTSATVKDGDYFIIGGLTQESHLVTKSKIPILGDVPLAGELFKLHNESRAKTELYIVVTPHIVRDGDSAIARDHTPK